MADHSAEVDLGISNLGPAVRIGRGGFADVYRAEQRSLRRVVAVKVLHATASDPNARMRFERECQALGAVSGHPNIVAVHESGLTTDGKLYLMMEYCPGGSLLDRLQHSGPLAAAEVAEVGIKMGRALQVAHDAGVLHRDIKPANILITSFGELALADFGIAHIDGGQRTATGLVAASITHSAPEVLSGTPSNGASDVYSLGSTLYELVTGRTAFVTQQGESLMDFLQRVLNSVPPEPSSLGVGDPLASVIRIAMARNPHERYQRPADIADLLEAADFSDGGWSGQPQPQPPTRVQPTQPAWSASDPASPRSSAVVPTPRRVRWPTFVFAGLALLAAVALAARFGPGLGGEDELGELSIDTSSVEGGPLMAGQTYEIVITPPNSGTTIKLYEDEKLVTEGKGDRVRYQPQTGFHQVTVEAQYGEQRRRIEPIRIYAVGPLPSAPFRANLASFDARPELWAEVLDRYQQLVADGHQDLLILPNDLFSDRDGFWAILIADFETPETAKEYCVAYGLNVPDDCYGAPFEP